MKEKERQELLRSGRGISNPNLTRLIQSSSFKSWSGCMTGADWCGRRVVYKGVILNSGTHQQNDAPTGYEQRGTHTAHGWSGRPKKSDVVEVQTRFVVGRDREGYPFRKTESKKLVVVS